MRNVTINLHKPNLELWGELDTEVHESSKNKLFEEVLGFYDRMLVPELVCSADAPDRPADGWLRSEGKVIVTCRDKERTLLGCWVLKDHGIMYPCIDVTKGAVGVMPILRALAYESFKREGQEMWATTANPLIQAWVNNATSTPEEGRPEDMPLPRFTNGRVEWRV